VTGRAEALRVAHLAFAISFIAFIANGRAIGSGDTNAAEKTAAALATRGTVVLPEGEAHDPFTRVFDGGRVSIYPVLPPLLAAPFFFTFALAFELNPAGIQAAGKLCAALFAAGAVGLLAASFARRAPSGRALASALVFGLGTSVYSTSEALWQHPFVLLFMVIALRAFELIEDAPGRVSSPATIVAGLSLSLAAASRPAAIPICAVLFGFLTYRSRRRMTPALIAAAIPAALTMLYNAVYFGGPFGFGRSLEGRFLNALPESIAGLLVSPARGLLIFTPIALLALWEIALQARRDPLARVLLAAVVAHFTFIAAWNEWHGGESFGPRLLTDMLPALFFYLPGAFARWPVGAAVLGSVSIAVQLLGGYTYDYRWERLHQRGQEFDRPLWSWRDSPIVFALKEGVILQGHPRIEGRRLRLPVRRFVPFGPQGSTIEGTPAGLRISGASLLRDVRLERGARLSESWIVLAHPADALSFRVIEAGPRELRIVGSLDGTLRIEMPEGSILAQFTGSFDRVFTLAQGESGDVSVHAATGEMKIARVELK
jgi:hypothetical protein